MVTPPDAGNKRPGLAVWVWVWSRHRTAASPQKGGSVCLCSTTPDLPEAIWFETRDHIEVLHGSVVVNFRLGGRDAADGSEHAALVEPVDPTPSFHWRIEPVVTTPRIRRLPAAVGRNSPIANKHVRNTLSEAFPYKKAFRPDVSNSLLERGSKLYGRRCGLSEN